MRTTLTPDRDVVEYQEKEEMRRTGRGLKATINDALRRGLQGGKAPRAVRFEVHPHAFGVRPGIDLDRMNQLVDELDAAEAARKLAR